MDEHEDFIQFDTFQRVHIVVDVWLYRPGGIEELGR